MLPSGSALLRSVVINNIREKLVKILVTTFQVSVILKNGAFLWQHQKTKHLFTTAERRQRQLQHTISTEAVL